MPKLNSPYKTLSIPTARVERGQRGIKIEGLCATGAESTMADQCQSALEQGRALLEVEGLTLSDVTRVTYMIADAEAFSACVPVLRRMFPHTLPALTFMWVGREAPVSSQGVIELAFYVERPGVFL